MYQVLIADDHPLFREAIARGIAEGIQRYRRAG